MLRIKKFKKFFLIILLIISLLFISGQQGCQQENSKASKSGVDFALISRQDTLYEGKKIYQGETFYVGIKIENYDKKEKEVEVCISDSILDQYGGIIQKNCQQVFLPAAEMIKKESYSAFGKSTTEQLVPGTKEVFFPTTGQYVYKNLPKMNKPFEAKLFISLKYLEDVEATTVVPIPSQEQPPLTQEPSQITVSISKSIYPKENSYYINFDLNFIKNPYSRIFLQDFSEENENKTYFNIKLASQNLNCKTTNGQQIGNILEIKNSKLIRCSTILPSSYQRQDYLLVLRMMYGVLIEKNYNFFISTKEEI